MPTPKLRSLAEDTSGPRPVVERDLARELQKYKGRWVALFAGAIVAVGDSAADVVSQALRKGVTDPMVVRVPHDPDRLAYYRRA